MKKIILLFIASFLVTAVFSASLKVFFQAVSWREVLIKGLLIPCFTWTMQLLLSAIFLKTADRLTYWHRLGWVCLIGSIALLPAAFYNTLSSTGRSICLRCCKEAAATSLMKPSQKRCRTILD